MLLSTFIMTTNVPFTSGLVLDDHFSRLSGVYRCFFIILRSATQRHAAGDVEVDDKLRYRQYLSGLSL